MQSAQASEVSDADGDRGRRLFYFLRETQPNDFSGGSTQPISTLNVRATEYTVGDNGPEAMPAELPPTSAYTYAVEVSVDETLWRREQSAYLLKLADLLLSGKFPRLSRSGTPAPIAYYDGNKAACIPTDDGKVVKILAIKGGLADLDTTGDGRIR